MLQACRRGAPAATPVGPGLLSPDLVGLLQEMGLAWDEVCIYQFLLTLSSAVSSAIVRETGHSRGRIYEALRRLVGKGLVREEPTRPIQFHPTPLAEILATAHARLTRQLAAVKAGQAAALAIGDGRAAIPLLAPTKPRDVRVLSGRRTCHSEWSRMLGEAGQFFWLTGGEQLAHRLAAMPEFLRQAPRPRTTAASTSRWCCPATPPRPARWRPWRACSAPTSSPRDRRPVRPSRLVRHRPGLHGGHSASPTTRR